MPVRPIPSTHEIRGHRLRVYLRSEEHAKLEAMQAEMRRAWNLLCGWRRAHLDACVCRAERDGVIGPAPETPPPISSEDDLDASRAAWRLYWRQVAARAGIAREYATKHVAGYGFLKLGTNAWDYSALRSYAAPSGSVCRPAQYQALIRNFTRAKRPKPRRSGERMPLQVMSGKCYVARPPDEMPNDRRGIRANVTIVFAGMKLRAREHRPPGGEVLEGVTLRQETDGWYAAVKVVRPKQPPPTWSIDDVIGISLGLEVLCTTSTGKAFKNPRSPETARTIAALQRKEKAVLAAANDDPSWNQIGSVWRHSDGSVMRISTQSARLHTRLSRRVRDCIQAAILPYLAQYRYIAIGDDDGMPRASDQVSGYVPAVGLLRASIIRRFGPERVILVPSRGSAIESDPLNAAQAARAAGLAFLTEHGTLVVGSTVP